MNNESDKFNREMQKIYRLNKKKNKNYEDLIN